MQEYCADPPSRKKRAIEQWRPPVTEEEYEGTTDKTLEWKPTMQQLEKVTEENIDEEISMKTAPTTDGMTYFYSTPMPPYLKTMMDDINIKVIQSDDDDSKTKLANPKEIILG